MSERITKGTVESVVEQLNLAAQSLGIQRVFEFVKGQPGMGTQHQIGEVRLGLPVRYQERTKIGTNYPDALRYVEGMLHAYQIAKRDRDYRREEVLADSPLPTLPRPEEVRHLSAPQAVALARRISDPDARSATRATEERATDRIDPRPLWCALRGIHGPHGSGSRQPRCPGLEEPWRGRDTR